MSTNDGGADTFACARPSCCLRARSILTAIASAGMTFRFVKVRSSEHAKNATDVDAMMMMRIPRRRTTALKARK
jgi:hypothetical protein